ncbi:MAG: cytochrome c-type biogenesis protein CcmH [Rhodobacteraceae bacterium]|nr:cytochrome c-type biogenesis protein CcmH [Paracoccaceae bacterium]
MKRLVVILLLLASTVWAVEPEEMLADPVLEARAQELDRELRCVQCRSESIASSNAAWASDARIMVRELLDEGATNDEVKAFFVTRYGEVVLMQPNKQGSNALLWAAGPLMLLLAALMGWFYVRGRSRAAATQEPGLSEQEQDRVRQIMDE